jgi:vancomycin permeability regulator SanA
MQDEKAQRTENRGIPRNAIALAALAAIGVGITLACAAAFLAAKTKDARFTDIAHVPAEPEAIAFGAGVERDGTPSGMLADRLDAAVALYKNGTVQRLLLTGDHSRVDYDEVDSMRRYVLARGVPSAHVALDFAGFRTYDSCYRARAIFGVTRAVLVSQRYHLPRAVYTCRQLGIASVGLGTPDWGDYSNQMMAQYTAREWIASAVALWQLHVTKPPPVFLGKFEGMP